MQYIENYLTTQKAKLKVGHNKREYDTLVKALDIRTKQMLEELNSEPETVRHYQLMGTADERKSELDYGGYSDESEERFTAFCPRLFF